MSDALKKAIDLLARREHSCQELSNKLSRKGFASSDIEAAIERLQHDGLLSDQRFAGSYVDYRARAGFGPLRIIIELKERGVDASMIDQAVWQSDIDWQARCFAVWQKKYNIHERFGSKEYAIQKRFLMQRGYTETIIKKVIEQ